ncbi:hypothetical protein [Budvicia aquatica]|uniref:Uncharacterized protein n=1 Tax=Budvicia aquatica TaxID=82979 RepID=A0A484ZLG7_9GAMM|nr:hypothetical protein [Budvicia aquatica]VFS48748.1 Uncharacterised protein [Budvicia aquatica]
MDEENEPLTYDEPVFHPLDETQENISENSDALIDALLKEQIDKTLANYVKKFPDIQNLILSTVDGFEISSVLDQGGRKLSVRLRQCQVLCSLLVRQYLERLVHRGISIYI